MNISLSSSENISFETIEYVFLNHHHHSGHQSASGLSYILIIFTNGYLLYFIIRRPMKTFLDWMMLFDCILCVCNLATITAGNYKGLCYFIPFFTYFINLCNRLLSVGIVIYRYVFVIKNNLVRTTQQRKLLQSMIFGSIMMISLLLTGWSVYYKDVSRTFLCKYYSWL